MKVISKEEALEIIKNESFQDLDKEIHNKLYELLNNIINTPTPLTKSSLINAWIIYDKGMIPDSGTGEKQEPATYKKIKEAREFIEQFIKDYNAPSTLDKEVEEAIEEIEEGNYHYFETRARGRIDIVEKNKSYFKDEFNTIRTALSDKDRQIELINSMAEKQVNDFKKYKAQYHSQLNQNVYVDKIKKILGDDKNE